MKSKKFLVIALAVIFVFASVLSFVLIFSVKKVNVVYSVDAQTDVEPLQDKLDKFIGKNLILVNLEDVQEVCNQFPEYKVETIKKSFPNVIDVKIVERRVVYQVVVDQTVYGLDQTGFVVNSTPVSDLNDDKQLIMVDFLGVDILSANVGTSLVTSDNILFNKVMEMASSVRLTDCINKITVLKNLDFNDAVFYTYSGVTITVEDVLNKGVDKIIKGFESYDNAGDYEKSFDHIKVYYDTLNNQIVSIWTTNA